MELELNEDEFMDSEEGENTVNRNEVTRGSRRRARASDGGVSSRTKTAAKRTRRTAVASRQSNTSIHPRDQLIIVSNSLIHSFTHSLMHRSTSY